MFTRWLHTIIIILGLASATSRTAEAGIGTPGQPCTVGDYQAANECLASWVGLGGLFGGCDLVCNELGTGGPPPSVAGVLWSEGGQAVVDTIKAVPGAVVGIVTQIGNDIYECATDPFGGWQCVRVGVLVGGVACSVFVPGCAPVVMGAAIAGSTGYCAYVCLATSDEQACQQACAQSIVVNATVAYGGYRMSVAARVAAAEDAAVAGGGAGGPGGGGGGGQGAGGPGGVGGAGGTTPRPMPPELVPQVGTPRPPPGVKPHEMVNGQVVQNPTSANLSAGEPLPTPPPGAPSYVNVGMTPQGNAVAAAEVNGLGHPTLAPVNGSPTILAAAGELRPLPGGGWAYAPRSRYNNIEPPTSGQVQAFVAYLRSIGIDVREVVPW